MLKSEELHQIKDCEVSLHRIKAKDKPPTSRINRETFKVKKRNVYSCPYCGYKNKPTKVFIEKHIDFWHPDHDSKKFFGENCDKSFIF
jgi:hypothetical protein